MFISLFKGIKNNLQNQKQPHNLLLLSSNITTEIHGFKSWARIVSELVEKGPNEMALVEASQMLNNGNKPNGYSLVPLIRACSKVGWQFYGKQLHCYALRSGFLPNVFISTSLVNFYLGFDSLSDAQKMFDEIPQPSVVSWNSLISGYVHSGQFRKALGLFLQLDRSDISSDSFSFTAALSACGQLNLLQLGKSVHSKVVRVGVESSVVVANCLIDMYGKCGSVIDSITVFNEMTDRDTISWNSVIAASARNRKLQQAVRFLHQMPNPDTISYNELINGIAQFGNMDDAIEILSNMPFPNSSSWNAIVTGYVNRDQARKAMDFFSNMHFNGIEMDQFTFSIILSGVGNLSALTWGSLIHCCTIKCGLDMAIVVGSALIDMYSKCGKVEYAESIFKSLTRKNLVTWNALISGFAHNGKSNKMMELYKQLKMVKDLKPDGITFLNVLSACWHNQTPFEVANRHFQSMIKDYNIDATPEHCASIIRIMGMWGEVWRGERMICELGFGSCGLVWRALLGACGACGDLKVAELAAAKVIELEGDKEFVYVMMSNMYAAYGEWDDVSMVREVMRQRSVRKEVGCSWIEIDNMVTR
ncbi:hypothetical protein Vadar_008395 [Vaccinium darrowii]|uniref:Uncharacterized protein n=1 Tax=Vaccinium darrowii TaxID=229202 RepID=A0ACB7Z9S4_9ERIC|nr:hypothetical protein Vadar_008395 [Vaccinium darrowii]